MTNSLFDDPKLWKERIESALSDIANQKQQRESWTTGHPYFPDPVELCALLTDDYEFEEYLSRHIENKKEDLYYARLNQDSLELVRRIIEYPVEKLRDVRRVMPDPAWNEISNLSASVLKRLREMP